MAFLHFLLTATLWYYFGVITLYDMIYIQNLEIVWYSSLLSIHLDSCKTFGNCFLQVQHTLMLLMALIDCSSPSSASTINRVHLWRIRSNGPWGSRLLSMSNCKTNNECIYEVALLKDKMRNRQKDNQYVSKSEWQHRQTDEPTDRHTHTSMARIHKDSQSENDNWILLLWVYLLDHFCDL